MAHEIGHQFRGNHTFNGNGSSCDNGNRNGSTAVEPGSGSTIMAYAGICGSHNIANRSDPYFHATSLQEIVGFITTGGGSTCGTTTETGNDIPVVTAPAGFVLPISTPFSLTGSATDATPDALTYTWEETDRGSGAGGAPARLGVPNGAPFFRSFTPTADPTRFFPQLPRRISNLSPVLGEALPDDARTLTFRLTVRDNQAGGGAIADSNTLIGFDAGAGPVLGDGVQHSRARASSATRPRRSRGTSPTRTCWTTPAPRMPTMSTSRTSRSCTRPTTAPRSRRSSPRRPTTAPRRSSFPTWRPMTPIGRIMVRAVGSVFFDINDIAFDVRFNTSGEETATAAATGLSAVTPNPATGRASFSLRGATGGPVSVAVYDALGRQVMRLHDGPVGDDQRSRST